MENCQDGATAAVLNTTTTNLNGDDVSPLSHHCAFCLKLSSSSKLCGKCNKRAYCSKQCQIADWSPGKTGQGHKNWCSKYECGEEDIDYEVSEIPGKGLGIVAKRLIPAKYRIFVEPIFTSHTAHPAIND